ncbi:MAG TPA: tryptophan synthase subunit alpha [Aggregatilineales bacterium]|jgi:tryptophan synthase alpha chain|nr:tryptophan synthase subunit alpha [Aggregatilineales bacterium]
MTPATLSNPLLYALRQIRASGRAALCGYFLIGYPTPDAFYRMVRAASAVDVIEYGIPAHNPLLDGPVIADAHEVVTMLRGLGAETALALVSGLRGIPQPRFVMTYAQVGRETGGFLRLLVENAVHGLLAPDLAAEDDYVLTVARTMNLAVINFFDIRDDDAALMRCVATGDVIYLKAAPGITGQRADFSGALGDQIRASLERIKALKPETFVAVGIGVQQPEQVAALARLGVDMVIVGTKVVEHVQQGEAALQAYLQSLRDATAG